MGLFQDPSEDVIKATDELTEYVLGRKSNADLGSNCGGGCGSSYCACCPQYKMVVILFAVVAIAYVGASFGLALKYQKEM